LLINAVALWITPYFVSGISYQGSWASLLLVALVFGVLNASLRPLLKLLTFPLLILTLGLFTFVINAFMLLITGWISDRLNLGFHVAGFWSAFWGGLVISIVSLVMSLLVKSRQRNAED
jgi:putative membrane protein